MDIERLAEFIIKALALFVAIQALEIVYNGVVFVMAVFDYEHYAMQIEHEGWFKTLIPFFADRGFSFLFNVIMVWLLWSESKRISQFILKRIK